MNPAEWFDKCRKELRQWSKDLAAIAVNVDINTEDDRQAAWIAAHAGYRFACKQYAEAYKALKAADPYKEPRT